jgi:hypothetical protein
MEAIAIKPQKSKTSSLLKKPAGIPLKKAASPKVVAPKVATSEFRKILHKLRSKASKAPTMEEITAEVEMIRMKRYAKR